MGVGDCGNRNSEPVPAELRKRCRSRVHDFRLAVFHEGFLQRIDAWIGCQVDRHAPSQYPTGCPIEDDAQIEEAPAHREVGRIQGPDLIRAVDDEVTQQSGIDAVRLIAPAGIDFSVDGLDVEFLHQCADMLATDLMAFQLEHVVQHSCAGKGMF